MNPDDDQLPLDGSGCGLRSFLHAQNSDRMTLSRNVTAYYMAPAHKSNAVIWITVALFAMLCGAALFDHVENSNQKSAIINQK